ncbi:hypothetical protein Mgra_00000767 [Meloidogyne graminicola]|uniref:Uncharacterized protein n=1 Tax=Meloidogyne graminicola TaxID=189291 RepID=A0A8T0A209_9BILA|nr:hypothetical protein Mgra_00000767 [Meloidogyne graminicola]
MAEYVAKNGPGSEEVARQQIEMILALYFCLKVVNFVIITNIGYSTKFKIVFIFQVGLDISPFDKCLEKKNLALKRLFRFISILKTL